MIIDDFDVERVAVGPLKTDAPLAVDPDAVLTNNVTPETPIVIRWLSPNWVIGGDNPPTMVCAAGGGASG